MAEKCYVSSSVHCKKVTFLTKKCFLMLFGEPRKFYYFMSTSMTRMFDSNPWLIYGCTTMRKIGGWPRKWVAIPKNRIQNYGYTSHEVFGFHPYLTIQPVGPNGKIVLYCFVHVYKKYQTGVGNRQIRILWNCT